MLFKKAQNKEEKHTSSGVKHNRKKQTKEDAASIYNDPRSIVDFLPVVEYLKESEVFLLKDGISVMKVFDAKPFSTEGRSNEYLTTIAQQMQSVFQDVFDEQPKGHEWQVWTYAYYEDNFDEAIDRLKRYPVKHAIHTEYTKTYIAMYEQHLRGMCKDGGIFEDDVITKTAFRGNTARCKVCIYRIQPKNIKITVEENPEFETQIVAKKFIDGMKNIGVQLENVDGTAWYDFMLQWFNPRPKVTGGDKQKLREVARYEKNEDLPAGDDLSESYFFEAPRSSLKHKCWVFDGMPHRFLRVHKIRRPPKIACLTGEIQNNAESKEAFSLMDRLPPGAIVVSGTIITSQDEIESHINNIERRSKGDSSDALHARHDCEIAKGILGAKHRLYRGMMGIYLRADNLQDLRKFSIEASTQLLNQGLQPIVDENEMLSLDAYLFHLPGVYEPAMDKKYRASRPMWSQHVVNASGFFGRNTGTQHPGMSFFNRGGGDFSVDPFSLDDRAKNAHAILNGPTGSGKSATLTAIAAHVMAMHRPRLFMLELGNSFGLLGDFFAANGLKVHKVQITPENAAKGLVQLAPFTDAHQLLEDDEIELLGKSNQSEDAYFEQVSLPSEMLIDGETINTALLSESEKDRLKASASLTLLSNEIEIGEPGKRGQTSQIEDDTEGSDQRDIMGECEIVATLMITGGEPEETKKLTRADRRMIRDAILQGARIAVSDNRITTVSDVCAGFALLAQDEKIPQRRRERAHDMGEAMRMFTDGFEGDLFNGEGEAWPDADVTIVDVATLGREGYQAQLAIAYSSILMRVNNIAEKNQHGKRQNLMLTDEAHIVTTNPLLSGYIVKIVKTWRKLQTWYWAASQNVKDYPDQAQKLLNMVEWFFMLVMPADEVNDLDRFRPVTDAQKKMMLSASKSNKKYTEGVLLSDRVEALIRMVPPSLMLALAGTEGDEKSERMDVMKEFSVSEVEAAIYIAKKIDFHRGLRSKMPENPTPNPKYGKSKQTSHASDLRAELGNIVDSEPEVLKELSVMDELRAR